MAITFIGSAVQSSSPNAGMTLTLPTGSMITNDLILIAAAVADTVDNGLAAPTEGGYTDVLGAGDLYADDTNDINLDFFYKYWDGVETTATFGAVGGTNASNVAVCMVFRGVATAAQGGPFSATPTTATGIDTSNANPPSIATVAGDAVVIVGATGHTGTATATYTSPANYTAAVYRAHNDTIDGLVGMAYRLSGYANPEDPGVFTAANIGTASANAWAAITMALKASPPPSLVVDSGTYVVTGTVASLERGYLFASGVGSYVLTGALSNLLYLKKIISDSGTYTVTGSTLNFIVTHIFSIEAGVYTLTGINAALLHDINLLIDNGSYIIIGDNVILTFSGSGAPITPLTHCLMGFGR